MSKLALNQITVTDPFKVLFEKAVNSQDVDNYKDRIAFIDDFTTALGQTSAVIEEEKHQSTWTVITSVFATAITVSGAITLGSPIIACVAILAAAGAVTGISESVTRTTKLTPVGDELSQHHLALQSKQASSWAALWQYCYSVSDNADEIFRRAMFKASRGHVQGDRLINRKGSEPLDVAVKAVAERLGATPSDVFSAMRAIVDGHVVQSLPQSTTPKQLQIEPAIGINTVLNAIPTESVTVLVDDEDDRIASALDNFFSLETPTVAVKPSFVSKPAPDEETRELHDLLQANARGMDLTVGTMVELNPEKNTLQVIAQFSKLAKCYPTAYQLENNILNIN